MNTAVVLCPWLVTPVLHCGSVPPPLPPRGTMGQGRGDDIFYQCAWRDGADR